MSMPSILTYEFLNGSVPSLIKSEPWNTTSLGPDGPRKETSLRPSPSRRRLAPMTRNKPETGGCLLGPWMLGESEHKTDYHKGLIKWA